MYSRSSIVVAFLLVLVLVVVTTAAVRVPKVTGGTAPFSNDCVPATYSGDCHVTNQLNICAANYEETKVISSEDVEYGCLMDFETGLAFSANSSECSDIKAKGCIAVSIPDPCNNNGVPDVVCNAESLCDHIKAGNTIQLNINANITTCSENVGYGIWDVRYDNQGPRIEETVYGRLGIDLIGDIVVLPSEKEIPVGTTVGGVFYSIPVELTLLKNPLCDEAVDIACDDWENLVKFVEAQPRWKWPCFIAIEFPVHGPAIQESDVRQICQGYP